MIKVALVFGTRPETIKLARVIQALRRRPTQFETLLCATAQHRQMTDQALDIFGLRPDYDLDIMSPGQSLSAIAAKVFERLDPVLERERPDWVLTQGDTTTVMAASLAAFHRQIKVGHVEAGLRSGDRARPFPEEVNRRVADVVADLHFAPTPGARAALLREGVEPWRIDVTGNTVIDALHAILSRPYQPQTAELQSIWRSPRKVILVTAHRRESFGAPLRGILCALRDLADRFRDEITIVYPVHPNPQVAVPANDLLSRIENVTLLQPLDYVSFAHLMKRSYLILTDSGGIQEEAPSIGKPVLVMRTVTERPEGIAAGTARLIGSERKAIVEAVTELLADGAAYHRMANAANPYGDGKASERIVDALLAYDARAASQAAQTTQEPGR